MHKEKRRHTVRGQYLLVILVTLLGGILLLGFFSFEVIRDVVENRGRAYMISAADMIGEDLAREYDDVLHISQHMMPSGRVGMDMDMVLSASSTYDRGEAKRMLARDLSLITFSVRQSELALYANENGKTIHTSTMSVKSTFDARELTPLLRHNRLLRYNAVHTSQSYISNHPVISVTREAVFSDDNVYLIYVEMRTSLRDSLQAMSYGSGLDYAYLQLDDEGNICYTTDPAFAPGQHIGDQLAGQNFGYLDDHVWARSEAKNGSASVIMLHRDQFYAGIFSWIQRFLLALCAAILLVIGSAVLLKRLVLRKMQVMVKAIDSIGQDSLQMTAERTGLVEFDLLMDRFELMLGRVRQLISDVERKESERAQEELEKLYYQINPHFLMNSLNSVHWLARMSGQNEIREMVHHLSVILNYSLGRAVEQPTLRTELDILKNYVALESNRHTFHTDFDIEDGVYLEMPSARLILQPLVENAIGHGMNVDGHLHIAVHPVTGGAQITIADDGCGLSEEMLAHLNEGETIPGKGGVGLKYVRSMLGQFFGPQSIIHFASNAGQGTIVTLKLISRQ